MCVCVRVIFISVYVCLCVVVCVCECTIEGWLDNFVSVAKTYGFLCSVICRLETTAVCNFVCAYACVRVYAKVAIN